MEGAVTVAQHQDLLPGDVAEPHQAGALLSLLAFRRCRGASPLSGETELEIDYEIQTNICQLFKLFMLQYIQTRYSVIMCDDVSRSTNIKIEYENMVKYPCQVISVNVIYKDCI